MGPHHLAGLESLRDRHAGDDHGKSWDEILMESEGDLVVQHDCPAGTMSTATLRVDHTDASGSRPRVPAPVVGSSVARTLPSQGAVMYCQQAPTTTERALASLGPVSIRTGADAPGRRGRQHCAAEDGSFPAGNRDEDSDRGRHDLWPQRSSQNRRRSFTLPHGPAAASAAGQLVSYRCLLSADGIVMTKRAVSHPVG